MERAVGGLAARHQADAALQDRRIAEGKRGDLRLHARISPPHRLLAPGAIDERIEQAIPLRLAAHAPDFVELRIAALKFAGVFHARVDLAHADVANLQWLLHIAEDQRGELHAAIPERLPALRPARQR